jgi:predicted O-linked N-acetylglucosamine transferase (SPINDLY family)
MDYFLSARDLEPESGAQDHYTETLIRLNNLPTYYYRPTVSADAKRSDFDLPEGRNLYLCPHIHQKFHPDFDDVIGGILRKDKAGSVVLVRSTSTTDAKSALQARLRSAIPDVFDRITFLPRVPNPDFLQFLSVADAVLDPLHFGCGRMIYEATAVGVPIVTCPGQFMRARVVSALYKRMGITECVVQDQTSYIDTAVRLATDRRWRQAIVDRIRQRSHVVFEQEEAVLEMAEFFKQAVRAADQGRKIEHWNPDHA